ncbi:MAG: vWA domain-containing protein [Myxococcota bacterium]
MRRLLFAPLLLSACTTGTATLVTDGGATVIEQDASDDAGDAGDAGPDDCARVEVAARRVTPNVYLVIDQSSSMNATFGGSTRWLALRESLLDAEDGLVASLEGIVRFGLALYSARAEGNDPGPPIGECPLVELVDADLNNLDSIEAVYGMRDPIDETPTGEAIEVLTSFLLDRPDPPEDPTIFVLATDGEPDQCSELNPQNGQGRSVAAAETAFAAGVRTFVISVGAGVVSDEHLQDMANAGLGRGPEDDNAPFFVAGDDEGLRSALQSIIGGALSCELTLDGRIENLDQACTGEVLLNGRRLECDDPNGWRAIDAERIELVGTACDEFLAEAGVTLTASFPCEIILI